MGGFGVAGVTGATQPGYTVHPYAVLLSLLLPITSFLVVPSVQGTTPGYLLSLGLLVPWVSLIVMGAAAASRFYTTVFLFGGIFAAYVSVGQLVMAMSPPIDQVAFFSMPLMDSRDTEMVLRGSLFTQAVYLLAAICAFSFFRTAYQPGWDRYVLGGAVLLGAYGVYEFLFFLVTGGNGDFLTNRTFGLDNEVPGSLFQTMPVGPIELLRLKSLTGEPSMYAFTVLPFWIYALHTGHRRLHWFLLVTLLLSTSTTAFTGLAVYLLVRLILRGTRDIWLVLAVLLGFAVLVIVWLYGNELVENLFRVFVSDKIAARDVSGSLRLANATAVMSVFEALPWMSQLFGIGFGYVRSSDFLTTLLINTGVFGLIAYTALFVIPIMRLGNSSREIGLRAALSVVLFTSMISVPEFAYLSSWVFLGIAYHALSPARSRGARSSSLDSAAHSS
jgi:O-Antigen ligase